MPYYRTQKEKNEAERRLAESLSKLPTSINDIDKPSPVAPPKKKKKYRPPQSGFKLGDVMPQELKDKAYAYRRRLKSGKLRESNNFKKGDQHYGKRQANERRTS